MTSNSEINDSTVFVDTSQALPPAPGARLICLDEAGDANLAGFEITLTQGEKMLGRSPDNAVCIPHKRLSRRHARLIPEDDTWAIEDLNSTNGVFVNEKRERRAKLKDGDIIKLGPIALRFELLQSQQPAPASHVTSEASSSVGGEGTMYAGHAEVLASLAAAQKESAQAPTQRPSMATPSHAGEGKTRGASNYFLRYGFMVLLILGVIAAGFFYLYHQRQHELDLLVEDYNLELREFLENYENSSADFSRIAQEKELEEIRDLKARVDNAATVHASSLELKELQAKILFLEFERILNQLLRTQDFFAARETQNLLEARELINDTREEASRLLQSNAETKNAISEVLGLLDLADIVVEFKEFRQRFPNPSITSNGLEPNRFDLNKMETLEAQFIEKKKANVEPLFRYTEFQNLLESVEEQDMSMVDRWKAILNLKR